MIFPKSKNALQAIELWVQSAFPHTAASNGKVTRFGDVYYAGMGNIAVYYDTVSGVTGAVCGKADCTHNSMACNAFLDLGNITGLQIYDGKIYWLQGAGYSRILYRMDLDGNNREQVQVLDDISGIDPRFAIHRGYVYTTVLKSEVQNRQSYYILEIKQYMLGQEKQEAQIIYTGEYTGDARYYCRFLGNHMYVAVENDVELKNASFNRQFFSYDMKAQEWKLLWEDTLPWTTRAYIVDETLSLIHISVWQKKILSSTHMYIPLFSLAAKPV